MKTLGQKVLHSNGKGGDLKPFKSPPQIDVEPRFFILPLLHGEEIGIGNYVLRECKTSLIQILTWFLKKNKTHGMEP